MSKDMEVTPPDSLIKYESPVFVGEGSSADMGNTNGNAPPTNKGQSQIDEILNSILPPREWAEYNKGTFMQYTSKDPATRLDVITLQEEMDSKLMDRQARETGICPVREDLYSQAFDELVRQVTINCPERGLLLLRVRDEIKMTIDAYKTLYDSSVTFGVRKQLQAESGMQQMEDQTAALQNSKAELENHVLELRNKVEVIEKRESERRALEEKKRKEEVEFLKYQAQHLDTFLKSIGGK
jgi:dynein light intermediate chain